MGSDQIKSPELRLLCLESWILESWLKVFDRKDCLDQDILSLSSSQQIIQGIEETPHLKNSLIIQECEQ